MKVAYDLHPPRRISRHDAKEGGTDATLRPDRLRRRPRASARSDPRGRTTATEEGSRLDEDARGPTREGGPPARDPAKLERTEGDLGGEPSPWKDRAFWSRQRCWNVTDSSVEQGLGADRPAPDPTPARGEGPARRGSRPRKGADLIPGRRAGGPCRTPLLREREPADPKVTCLGRRPRRDTGPRTPGGRETPGATPPTTHPSASDLPRQEARSMEWDTRSDLPRGGSDAASEPHEGRTWSGGTEREPPRRGDPAKVTSGGRRATSGDRERATVDPDAERGASDRSERGARESREVERRQRQEGKDRGDTERLSTRGILRRVRAAP
jgi:hypothetical protein